MLPMFKKSALPLPLSLLVSLLHVGCCLLPLLSIAGLASNFDVLIRYKPFFLVLQVLLLIYLSVSLVRFYLGIFSFHGQLEIWSYHIAFAIALAGMVIGVSEPFRSEQQILAERQFQMFRTHRHIKLSVYSGFDAEKFKEDIVSIQGVKPASVKIEGSQVSATFKSDKVSSVQIVYLLQKRGYDVALSDQ